MMDCDCGWCGSPNGVCICSRPDNAAPDGSCPCCGALPWWAPGDPQEIRDRYALPSGAAVEETCGRESRPTTTTLPFVAVVALLRSAFRREGGQTQRSDV